MIEDFALSRPSRAVLSSLWQNGVEDVALELASSWASESSGDDLNLAKRLLAASYLKVQDFSSFDALCEQGVPCKTPAQLFGRFEAAIDRRDLDRANFYYQAAAQVAGNATPHAHTSVLERLRGEQLETRVETPAKIVTVLGVSYSGSTTLASILGQRADTANIGESHRLLMSSEVDEHGYHSIPFDFDDPNVSLLEPCISCGANCQQYDFSFRASLNRSPAFWYEKIANQSGKKILVATDKMKTRQMSPDPRHHPLVLFKDPASFLWSYIKREKQPIAIAKFEEYCRTKLAIYARSYNRILTTPFVENPPVFVDWVAFTADHKRNLPQLETALGLPETSTRHNSLFGQHCFGGNQIVNSEIRRSQSAPEIRTTRSRSRPPKALMSALSALPVYYHSRRVYERLRAKHAETFR